MLVKILMEKVQMKNNRLTNIILLIMLALLVACSDKSSPTQPEVKNPPTTPQNLTASDKLYGNKIVVKWGKVDLAEKYNLYRSLNDTLNFSQLATVTDTVYSDTTATASLVYYYKVQAQNQDGNSNYSYSDSGSACKMSYRIIKEKIDAFVEIEGQIMNIFRNYYTYSETGMLILKTDSAIIQSNSPFILYGKTYYNYNLQNLLANKIFWRSYSSNYLCLSQKNDYTYEQERIAQEVEYDWHTNTNNWSIYRTYNYIYNTQNLLTEIKVAGSDQYERFYYSNNQLDSSIRYNINYGIGNFTQIKFTYTYNNDLLVKKDYYNKTAYGWNYYGTNNYEYESYLDSSKTSHKNQNNQIIFNQKPLRLVK